MGPGVQGGGNLQVDEWKPSRVCVYDVNVDCFMTKMFIFNFNNIYSI